LSADPMAVWLDAHTDAMAAIHTTPSCIRMCDITGDGDPKLLVADQNRKLRLYKGINLVSEHALLDTPSAICPFWEEKKDNGPRVPSLAVACGQFIFIYKRLRPHYKFTLPTQPIHDEESAIWKVFGFCRMSRIHPSISRSRPLTCECVPMAVKPMCLSAHSQGIWDGSMSHDEAYDRLAALVEQGVTLTHQSNDFLSVDDPADRPAMIEECQGKQPVHTTTITCMETINKTSEEEGATSCLIVGTEHKQVVILDATGFSILVKVNLPSQPVFISATGLLDIEYRLAVGFTKAHRHTCCCSCSAP
jgi:Bardet-Biedl syndrome 1 protein